MWRSLDKRHVPALYHPASFRVLDPVGERFVLAEAAQHSFPGLGFQLLGTLDVDKSSSADDLEMRQIGLLAVLPLERRIPVKSEMWHTVAEVSRSEHELPPQLWRESTIDEKAANHTAKGPANALGYALLLRREGGRKFLGDDRFQAILVERFARVFPSFVGTPANDSAAARDDS